MLAGEHELETAEIAGYQLPNFLIAKFRIRGNGIHLLQSATLQQLVKQVNPCADDAKSFSLT